MVNFIRIIYWISFNVGERLSDTEDNEKGNLDVTINYLKLAQDVENALCFLNRLKNQLDIAAIKKGAISRERRNGERRK